MLPTNVNKLLNDFRKKDNPPYTVLPETSPTKGASSRTLEAVDAFVLCTKLKDEPEVSELLEFTRGVIKQFREIHRGMSYRNPNYENDHKDALYASGWAGMALIPMAISLFALKKSGVDGHMLECGVYKGGTTACMSHVCAQLGIKLYAADSFQGLPHGSADGYYKKGQFLGQFDEVVSNVEKFGSSTSVEYIRGWFSESLQEFKEPLALVFLDTDLYESSFDALNCIGKNIVPDGVIFSDGLGSARDFVDGHLVGGSDEARAICDHLKNRGVPQKAVTTGQDFLGLVVPGCQANETVTFSPSFSKALVAILGNELERSENYLTPLSAPSEVATELLSDHAIQAIDLRASLSDYREALAAVEKLVGERDEAIRSTEKIALERWEIMQQLEREVVSLRAELASSKNPPS